MFEHRAGHSGSGRRPLAPPAPLGWPVAGAQSPAACRTRSSPGWRQHERALASRRARGCADRPRVAQRCQAHGSHPPRVRIRPADRALASRRRRQRRRRRELLRATQLQCSCDAVLRQPVRTGRRVKAEAFVAGRLVAAAAPRLLRGAARAGGRRRARAAGRARGGRLQRRPRGRAGPALQAQPRQRRAALRARRRDQRRQPRRLRGAGDTSSSSCSEARS
jgi:hypothetical protein